MKVAVVYLIIITIIITLVIFSFIGYSIYFGYLRFNYPLYSKYPVRGLDVSHHQGKLDWERLRDAGFKFVFVKATEGGNHIDKMFQQNVKLACANDFRVGAYHYYRLNKSGFENANNIIRVLDGTPLSLPPAIDLELTLNKNYESSKAHVKEELKACLIIIENHFEIRPIIYTTKEFYNEYLRGDFEDYQYWCRSVIFTPGFPEANDWLFWQYGVVRYVDGTNGLIDLNVFNGSIKEFDSLTRLCANKFSKKQ